MGRIAGIHIGPPQKLEAALLHLGFPGPGPDQLRRQPLGLGAQEVQLVGLGTIKGQDQQDTVVEALGSLMELEGGFFVPVLGRLASLGL